MIRTVWQRANQEGNRSREHRMIQFERRTSRENILALASLDPRIQLDSGQLDRDPMLLNCLNGTLNLHTGELLPHAPERFIPFRLPIAWRPDAQCPVWEAFLLRVFDGDQKLISYVKRCIGYTLTGSVAEQSMFLLYGEGANGKTTLLNTLLALLGSYAHAVDSTLLAAGNRESYAVDSKTLFRSRLIVVPELPQGQRLNESKLKALTGGDRMLMKHSGEQLLEHRPTHKLWMSTNHLPRIHDTSDAIWRRLVPIPFNVKIGAQERDRLLQGKLLEELPGILRWAVEGTQAWLSLGLEPPAQVREILKQYRSEQDRVAQFIEQCCVTGDDKDAPSKDLFLAYKSWSEANGEEGISQTAFGRRLSHLGFDPTKKGGGTRKRLGLALREAAISDAPADASPSSDPSASAT